MEVSRVGAFAVRRPYFVCAATSSATKSASAIKADASARPMPKLIWVSFCVTSFRPFRRSVRKLKTREPFDVDEDVKRYVVLPLTSSNSFVWSALGRLVIDGIHSRLAEQCFRFRPNVRRRGHEGLQNVSAVFVGLRRQRLILQREVAASIRSIAPPCSEL